MRAKTKDSLTVVETAWRQHTSERLAKAISQQRLAEMADLNIRNVQRIEAGELDVLLTTAIRIRKALDCPLERIVPKDS